MMKIKKILKNEKGNTLVFVLVTLVVASILAMTVIFLADTNFRVANKEEKNSQAYYIARTGADALAQYIAVNPDGKDTGKILEELAKKGESKSEKFGDGEFKVKVKQDEKQKKAGFYEITSTGKQGKEESVASVIMAPVSVKDVFKHGTMFSKSDLVDIKVNTNIVGPIASNGKITKHDNNKYIQEEDLKPYVDLSFPEPEFPEKISNKDDEIIEIKNDIDATTSTTDILKRAKKITIKDTIKIKTSENRDIILLAKDLIIEKDTKIEVTGLGKVYFYVENSVTIKNKNTMTVDKNSYSLLYLKVGSNLTIGNDGSFKGYIYGPSATVNVENKASIIGFIIAGEIKIDNQCFISPITDQTQDNINIDLGINLGYKKDVWKK